MNLVENGDNTQRVISNDKLISDEPAKAMPTKKKVAIAIAVFLAIGAIVGLVVGLYFHYQPGANHLETNVAQANDGTVHLSTKFQYVDNNLNADDVNQTFTLMIAGLNSSQTQRRMLQTQQGSEVNADTTLHYTHPSGFKIKFRGNQVLNISVPIDQVVEYIAQQEDPVAYARLLQDITQYNGQDQDISAEDVYNMHRDEILQSIQSLYPNADNVHVYMKDSDIYELDFDQNSGKYTYTDNATSAAISRRRLLHFHFRHFFRSVGHFLKKAGGDVVKFVKKDGLKILKYGAIAALAGIDIATKGPSGILDAIKMFKSGNLLSALETTAQGVVTGLVPGLSIPIEFLNQACFSHPPKMHCTKKAAINAAKTDAISYVKKHALSTIFSLSQ